MESVTFNDIVLTDEYTVFGSRGMASLTASTADVPGHDGVIVKGTRLEGPSVSLTFITESGNGQALSQLRRELAGVLDVREPKKLEFGDDDGLYYMALPSGQYEWSQSARTGRLVVPFLVPSPAMYGAKRTATVPAGGSVTISVDGTYPTRPTLKSNGRVSTVDKLYSLTLDNSDVMQFLRPNTSNFSFILDCEARTATVDSSVALPTLNSDWFEFEPGSHTIENNVGGYNGVSVEWVERWL